jgi:hypothetical protein
MRSSQADFALDTYFVQIAEQNSVQDSDVSIEIF